MARADGAIAAGRAELQGDPPAAGVPPGGFARASWRAVVPAQARGIQAVAVDNGGALLALQADAPPAGAAAVASAPALPARRRGRRRRARARHRRPHARPLGKRPSGLRQAGHRQCAVGLPAHVFRGEHARPDHGALPAQRQVPAVRPAGLAALRRPVLPGLHADLDVGSAGRFPALHRHHLQPQPVLVLRRFMDLVAGRAGRRAPTAGVEHLSTARPATTRARSTISTCSPRWATASTTAARSASPRVSRATSAYRTTTTTMPTITATSIGWCAGNARGRPGALGPVQAGRPEPAHHAAGPVVAAARYRPGPQRLSVPAGISTATRETLLDYDRRGTSQFRIGLSVVP